MEGKIRFSIITVCFNSAKTISRTIESVIDQKFEGLQYVIVDGRSTDDTMKIVDSYRDKLEGGEFTIVSEPDRGIYDAMNKGIGLSKGELIGIINSDDWYEPGALHEVWEAYQSGKNRSVIIYGGINHYQGNVLEGTHYLRHEFLRERMIMHPACFVARSVYDAIGGFSLDYPYAADYDFLLRAFDRNIEFVGINRIFSSYRAGGASASKKMEKDVIRIQYRHGIHSKVEYISRMCIYYIKLGLFNIKQLVRKATGTGK